MDAYDTPIAQYTFRRSVLEKTRTYSVYVDRFSIAGPDLPPQIYYFGEVERVWLRYEHTKQRAYYLCRIDTKRGRIVLRHVSWEGFSDFADLRASYTPFVRTLLAQTAQRPNIRYVAGSRANFIAAIIGAPLMAILMVVAVNFGRTGSATLAGLMLSICLLMIGPSRPRRFDPLTPPDDLLPT